MVVCLPTALIAAAGRLRIWAFLKVAARQYATLSCGRQQIYSAKRRRRCLRWAGCRCAPRRAERCKDMSGVVRLCTLRFALGVVLDRIWPFDLSAARTPGAQGRANKTRANFADDVLTQES